MLTNWRWGESVCCLICAGISAELGVASSLSGVWSVPCSLCSGWTCGTPAIWSLGMSFWEVCVCPCGSWVRPEYTTHGEKKTGHTFHPPPSPRFRITCYNCPFLIQSSFKDVIKTSLFSVQVLSAAQGERGEVCEGWWARLSASEHRLHRGPRLPLRTLHSAQRSAAALC